MMKMPVNQDKFEENSIHFIVYVVSRKFATEIVKWSGVYWMVEIGSGFG